jgi:hypothetical protein
MLLKKSPKKCCGIETRNDRILQVDPLNRCCFSEADLESIFLWDSAKIFFQQHRPEAAVPISLNNVRSWENTGRHVLAVSL